MKVSVVTATWNSEKTVADTLVSVGAQDYQNIEHIVVDGGSTDSTLSIVKELGNKVSKIVSEKDQGIYDALNKGIGLATGDVVGFLHSDDIYAHKGVVSMIARAFEKGETDAVYGDLHYVSRNDSGKVIRRWKSGGYEREKLRWGWMPPHPTFYMKRECYQDYGCFDLCYSIAADYDSMLRYLWTHRVSLAYLDEVIVNMRVGGESNRSLKNVITKMKEDIRVMNKHGFSSKSALVGKNLSKITQFF